jgi:competence protein ComFC
MEYLSVLTNKFFDLLFPKICYGCGSVGNYLCDKCLKKIYINWMQRCHVCGKECNLGMVHKDCADYSFLDGLIFITLYDDFIERMILDVKYKFNFSILNDIGRIMGKFLKFYNLPGNYILTSVPLHKKKKNYRGFNQAEILAVEISKNIGKNYEELITRSRYTHTQVGFSKKEREQNLKNAFEINPIKMDKIKSCESILIIDDVFTTGSTLNECAKILKNIGVKKVYGFVFAKARL